MARVSGLVSGLDTDALIQELVSAYQKKQDTYVKKQTKLEWTQEIWKGLNTKVYGFYTGALRNARFSNTYNIKKATVSDSTKATVTASSEAVVGTQTLKISKLAKTAYLTGGKLKRQKKADGVTVDTATKLSGSSKLKELGFDESGIIKVSANGKDTEISVDGNTTINQMVVKLKDAGLSANFDETNQRLFVSASGSGKDKEFSIMAANNGGLKALSSLGLNSVSESNGAAYKAASEINVQQAADTAYTKYILTQANAQHTAEINEKNIQINGLKDQLKYREDLTYRDKLDKSWDESIQSYEEKNQKLDETIQEQLNYKGDDTTSSGTSVGDFLAKDGSSYAVDSDGHYRLDDKYYKMENGEQVLDREKLDNDVNGTGLSSEEILAQLGEINANVNAIAQNNALKESVVKTKELYQEALSKTSEAINQEITDLTNGITEIQSKININNELMQGSYAFKDSSGNMINDSETAYTAKDGTVWTYEALRNRLNEYSKVPDGTQDADGNPVTVQSIDNTGLSVNPAYKEQYEMLYKKYDDEQKMGKTLYEAYQKYTDKDSNETAKEEAAQVLGLDTSKDGAVRVQGQDAEIVLNGATYTSATNNFAINGLTITATGETKDGEEITISTTADIDGMYKSIKSLLSGYNDILKEMNTMYYASSSKGYEPLSDEEKEALTDTEVEKWEKKIKDSLLRRDSTLSSIMSVMKNSMAKSYTINGKSYSLSSFGINTSGYFAVDNEERGLYHIDGDPEDASTSGNKDKLRAALASDPDAVIQFFQKVSDDMYTQLTKKMSRTSLSSSYTIYNDKQMEKQYKEYSQIIDDWDDKIERYTEKYVKQFTAMETAMAKLQSSTSALSGLIG